ncbi:sensor protein [Candidatus Colwellia aromaticivorans]|uniref:sensor protein n=1 Tax=Candidatus Colwellia aromaticivorans TaxID=2267621 RepID=UPI000DF1A3FC|nr:sensor protein [Candidatus Colwellia aromaticivorans]
MHKLLLFILVCLTGCSATPVKYDSVDIASESDAIAIIEQLFWEQPEKHRVSELYIKSNFIAYSDGVSVKSKTIGSNIALTENVGLSVSNQKAEYKHLSNRVYFNSLSAPKLFKKRDWFIIQLVDLSDRVIKNIYTRDRVKAQKFISAILYFGAS